MAITNAERNKREKEHEELIKKNEQAKFEAKRKLALLLKYIYLRMILSQKLAAMHAAVDARAPASRPHVAMKLKKARLEKERADKVHRDNYAMVHRLNQIMKANRLDNRWSKPLPNFQQKVGLFYDAKSLNSKVAARTLLADADESEESYHNVKCYACEMKKNQYNFGVTKSRPSQDTLPPINSN